MPVEKKSENSENLERLQKFLSNAGIASRRGSEVLIEQGAVKINGKIAKLGDKVNPATDEIRVDGKVIKPTQETFYIAVNKPREYISSRFDPEKRRSVYSLLPKALQSKVWSVGRLDFYTEGLMLFTNDGDLTQHLAHPSFEHDKEYEVWLNAEPLESELDYLRDGIEIGNRDMTEPAKVTLKTGGVVFITIHEGKKRQIRRMFEKIGYKVKKLKRVRINKLKLGDLPLGKMRYVQKSDVV